MDHGMVDDIARILGTADAPMTPRQIAALVKRPRWWTHEKVYHNVSSLLVEYAKRGKWKKVALGMYVAAGTTPAT